MDPVVLSDLDGMLIDSKASVIRAFEWWADLRGLGPGIAPRIPHGRTAGVIALPGARELLERLPRIGIVTSCPLQLAQARLARATSPSPSSS